MFLVCGKEDTQERCDGNCDQSREYKKQERDWHRRRLNMGWCGSAPLAVPFGLLAHEILARCDRNLGFVRPAAMPEARTSTSTVVTRDLSIGRSVVDSLERRKGMSKWLQ